MKKFDVFDAVFKSVHTNSWVVTMQKVGEVKAADGEQAIVEAKKRGFVLPIVEEEGGSERMLAKMEQDYLRGSYKK